MVSPINYILDVKSPIEEAMRGYAFGRGDIEQRQVMQEREQMMGLRERQEARAVQEFEMLRAEAARQRAQAEAGQSALMRLMDLGPNATANDYSQAWLANPSIREDLGALKTMMEAPKLKTTLDTSSRLYALARQGNADAVRDELSLQFEAAKNSGDQAMAATYGSALEQMNTNPEAALQSIAATSAFTIMGLKGPEYLSKVDKALGLDGGAVEGASPIGKIAQDVEAGLIPRSVLDAQIRVEEKAGEEGLSLQQRIAEEARLRGEYAKRTEDLSSAERNFEIIQRSSQDNSGAGDIALVTSFMKMLDPGSVVRETEFATAANAGGLLARLSTIADRVESGQFLTTQQRADFQRLSGQYLEAAKEQEGRVQSSYQRIVDNYGLDPVNVFGARAVTAAPPPAAPAAAPTAAPAAPAPAPAAGAIPQGFMRSQSVIDAAARAGVTPEEMWAVMTPEMRARYGE